VRITGRSSSPAPRIVYLSGTPGIVYSDGTFEFSGVQPGRYWVAVFASDGVSHAASVVVGNKDISGLELAEVATLPVELKMPEPSSPAYGHSPGQVSLASVHGRVMEKASQQPITEGAVQLLGYRPLNISIDSEGRFEIPRLLPGSYEIELQIFGHEHTHETLVVGDNDVQLVVSSLRLY
jgi:hypothetical protein